jgi:hypothetical protein
MPVKFEKSGPNLKPVARCDEPGCTAYAPFGMDGHLGQAIDRKDARLAGRHYCREHNPDNSKETP